MFDTERQDSDSARRDLRRMRWLDISQTRDAWRRRKAILMGTSGEILVTGATGYVGGRLAPRLVEAGYSVRVLVRDARKLRDAGWANDVRVFEGDVLRPKTLGPALEGVEAAYYLIHSMTSGGDFASKDVQAATNFGEAARDAGVEHIVYLGGLGDPEADLSPHLRSRKETGEALRRSGVAVTELQAGIIIGPGSISFEIVRYLAERVPVMICPRWVRSKGQPIAIGDVVEYLAAAVGEEGCKGKIVGIGGPDVLTYAEMMKTYARVRSLRRLMINVPVLTPQLSSYWVHWVTPIPASYARPLVEGLRNDVLVRSNAAKELFPNIEPEAYETSVRGALEELEPRSFEGLTDAIVRQTKAPGTSKRLSRGMIVEVRQREVEAECEDLYRAFIGLGGSQGWPCDLAWRIRGLLDRMLGGVGMRRERPESKSIKAGDVFDFFVVEKIVPGKMIRLKAEMKLPGSGWLQFEAVPGEAGRSRLVQTSFYAPKGLVGLIYWYAMYPLHAVVFRRLIDGIVRRSGAKQA